MRRADGEIIFPLFQFCTATTTTREKQSTQPPLHWRNKRPWRAECYIMPMMLSFSVSQGFFVSIIYCYCNGEVSEGNAAVHQLIAAVLMRRNYLLLKVADGILCLNLALNLNCTFPIIVPRVFCSWKPLRVLLSFCFKSLVQTNRNLPPAASNMRVQ